MNLESTIGFEAVAVTTRSGHEESIHHAALVALSADGSVAFSIGDPGLAVFPRSSIKPLQAFAMVQSGLDLPDELLALVCASHDGQARHLDGARQILASAGLDESSLLNTADWPLDSGAMEDAVRSGGVKTSLQQNCSGKHSGMLATCRVNGWDLSTYLDESHPLQTTITDAIPALTGSPVAGIGVDGCGAPAHVISLVGLARAFRGMATGDAGATGSRIHRAMSSNPIMVGGPRRDVTLIMQGIDGLMAKDGAEGVFAAALPDGRAVALKVADGSNRARPPLMHAALRALGVDVSGVDPAAWISPVLGHGRRVGEVRIVGALAEFDTAEFNGVVGE
ncbi:MAG: asparaginase [Ilumatobacteraceae bacterium]|jgi:L-asparaginase II